MFEEDWEEDYDWDDDYDYCYECTGYGDDYYVDDDGELACRCFTCTMNPNNWEDGYWIGDD